MNAEILQLPEGLPDRIRREPIQVKKGSAVVKIYPGRPGKGFMIAWRESAGGARMRATRSDLGDAKKFAAAKAVELANGETWKLTMGQADFATWKRVAEIAAPFGIAPELAMAEWAEIKKEMGMVSPLEAVRAWREAQGNGMVPRKVPDLVNDFLRDRKDAIGPRWYRALEGHLEPFARHFTGLAHEIRGDGLNSFLDAIKAGRRTRKNYRASLVALFRYARSKNHLPRSWDELAQVPMIKAEAIKIKILTPDQMTSLLAAAKDNLVPFVCLTAFAGIRHEEMNGEKANLDWSDIDLERRLIYVPTDVAKTDNDRIVPIQPNLAEWLRPYARTQGPICALRDTAGALLKAKTKAGIPAGRNETRNTLRKSFISYRLAVVKSIGQVAEEAGNSPAMIKKNYRRPIPEPEAKRWFDIRPRDAAFRQMNLPL